MTHADPARRLQIGFGIPIVVMIVLTIMSYNGIVASTAGAASLRHTHLVIERLGELLSATQDIDAGYRGFAIAGNDLFLKSYEDGRARAPESLAAVETLTTDDPAQQRRVAALRVMVAKKTLFADEIVRARRDGGVQPASERIASGDGLRLTTDIRALIRDVGNEEERQLVERQAKADTNFRRLTIVLGSGVVGSILMLGLAGWTVMRDRAARRNGAQALRATEDRLRHERNRAQRYLDTAGVILLALDTQGRITAANRFACTTLGWSENELLGRDWFEFLEPRARDIVRERFGRLLLGDSSIAENTIRTRSGEERLVEWRSAVLRDDAGHVTGTFSSGTDITERHQAVEALRTTEERMRFALNNANVGIWDMDYSTGSIQWSETLESQYGLECGAFGGTLEAFIETVHPDDRASVLEVFMGAMASGDDFSVLNRSIHPDGTIRWLGGMGRFSVENGRPVRGVGISQDVTERYEAEAELRTARDAAEAATRIKSDFLANMSHEIRTPMNGVIGMTELVLDTELTAEQRENLRIVKSSADALLTVINDILDFSRMEAGKFELDPIDFNPRDAISDTANAAALRAHQKGLELVVDVDPSVPHALRGDVGRLRQILVNLLGNAIKFTARGEVVLRVTSASATPTDVVLHFSVRDTGVGIPLNRQKMIFEPFTQADGSVTRTYGGTGLGLTISAQLVHLMGGRLQVESEPDIGSTFHFTANFEPAQAPAIIVVPETVDLRDLSVLVVDDNATNRRLLEKILIGWRMIPTLTATAVDALAALRAAVESNNRFPLVLTDVQMPGVDGFSLAEAIKKDPAIGDAAIVILTSAGQQGDAARCEALGIAACLSKPIRPSELRATILTALAGQPVATRNAALLPRHGVQEVRHIGRVLLVEDNAINQLVARRLLEKRGYTVVVANNGREALAILDDAAIVGFGCVLMDVQMPEMDGFECTATIRGREQVTHLHLPIVAMTAHAMKEDEARCLAAGMDGYVTKPILPDELLNTVEEHFRSPHSDAVSRL